MNSRISRLVSWTVLTALLLGGSALGQKKPVQPEDYGKFETIRSGELSPDGAWLAWQVIRSDDKNELRVRRASGEGDELKAAHGEDASFSDDSQWIAYRIGKSRRERDKLTEEKKPIHFGAGLIRLDSGETQAFDEVHAFAFSGGGRWLALHKYPAEKPKGDSKGEDEESPAPQGSDLLVRDLESGRTMTLGNVSEFAWQDKGDLLAAVIQTGDNSGNGVMLVDPAADSLRVLDSSQSTYRRLA